MLHRFSNEYVRENYEVAKLCGAKGGGFVVDTHTLHRGAVEGSLPQDGRRRGVPRGREVRRHGRVEVGAALPFRGPGPVALRGTRSSSLLDGAGRGSGSVARDV